MNVMIAVTDRTTHTSLGVGGQSYWCVYPNYHAAEHDIIALYKKGAGIVQLYRISDAASQKQERECVYRDLITVSMVLLLTLAVPVTAKVLKAHSKLRDVAAVRRNFQSTVFKIDDEHIGPLLRLLAQTNPSQETEILNLIAPA